MASIAPAPPKHARTKANTDIKSTIAAKSIKSLTPLLDRILVQRIKAETKTAGGIFLPESAVKELNEAKVLAVGPGALDRDGKRIAPSVQPGDKVLIPQVCFNHFKKIDGIMEDGPWRMVMKTSSKMKDNC